MQIEIDTCPFCERDGLIELGAHWACLCCTRVVPMFSDFYEEKQDG